MLSRFDGVGFALLPKSINERSKATRFVKNISNKLDTSLKINNNEIFISSSIGASVYPNDANNAKDLLKHADNAMYLTKESGRNGFQFFNHLNNVSLKREYELSHALKTILKNKNKDGELFLVYQPLVNIGENNFTECEALIRWTDKQGNSVNTAEFIEIAEKSSLIQMINLFVIEEVCKQQYKWQEEGIDNVRININLAGNKRIFNELFKNLLSNIGTYDLKPELFGIELTEKNYV